MAERTPEDRTHLSDMCQLGRSQVEPMRNSNALLRTGGLTAAHMQQLAEDANEDIVVRGVGTVPVNNLMLARGVTPTYPLEYFELNGWLRPTVTLPELRLHAEIIDYFGYIRDQVKKDPPGVASLLAYIETLMSPLDLTG